jgi:hypothetical protein
MLEEYGYRREQIKDLSRRYFRAVLQWPRDERGGLVIPKKQPKRKDKYEGLRTLLRRRGWAEYQIASEIVKREMEVAENDRQRRARASSQESDAQQAARRRQGVTRAGRRP